MKQSSIYTVAGWTIAFGALISLTLLFTGAVFEASLDQLRINEIIRDAPAYTYYLKGQ